MSRKISNYIISNMRLTEIKALLFSSDCFKVFIIGLGLLQLDFGLMDLVLFRLDLGLHVLHGLGECFGYGALMVTKNSNCSVSSVVSQYLVVYVVFCCLIITYLDSVLQPNRKKGFLFWYAYDQSFCRAVLVGFARRCRYGRLWPKDLP